MNNTGRKLIFNTTFTLKVFTDDANFEGLTSKQHDKKTKKLSEEYLSKKELAYFFDLIKAKNVDAYVDYTSEFDFHHETEQKEWFIEFTYQVFSPSLEYIKAQRKVIHLFCSRYPDYLCDYGDIHYTGTPDDESLVEE
jgi:hypothetical protein